MKIAVLPIMDVKTHWNATLELLDWAYQLRECTFKQLQITQYSDYWPHYTTQDEWTTVKAIMEVLWPFLHCTLWMSKRHTVTLHHVIAVYNETFNHMDNIIQALGKKKALWKEDLFIAVKCAHKKLSEYYPDSTLTMDMLFSSTHILYLSRQWQSLIK